MLILFMTEELVENTDSMVYINDMIIQDDVIYLSKNLFIESSAL